MSRGGVDLIGAPTEVASFSVRTRSKSALISSGVKYGSAPSGKGGCPTRLARRRDASSDVLAQLISSHGAPRYLRPDNGPEFVSRALLEWMQQESIETALIDPGKPWQNGAHESFNGNLRDECLSLEWFRSRTEARVVIENWRRHYDAVRPHSSLN